MTKPSKRTQLRNDEFLKAIGERIRFYRLERGMTQTELAVRCEDDKDYSQISRMERGIVNFSVTYLKAIADALGIEPRDLLP